MAIFTADDSDDLYGTRQTDTLTGNAAANTLDGAGGGDTMAGGLGDDTYIVDNSRDVVLEDEDAGNDTVRAAVNYTLGENIENLILDGARAKTGAGNDGDNHITGNAGANKLYGAGGADTIDGGDGKDVLDGGTGADTMRGGAGDDVFIVDDAGDVVEENDGEGRDLVQSSVSFILGAHVENLTLTGTADIDGTGNGDVNTLTGNAGNNTLDGRGGADVMAGGMGDDSYIVDDAHDTIKESKGIDTVYASVDYTLAKGLENLVLTGIANLNGTGNTDANSLTGNDGANTLDGGRGADVMAGGAGDDAYIVADTTDTVIELAGGGTDTVYAAVTYALPDEVENLVLTGTRAANGTGNALDNMLTGNRGVNTLDGDAGADTMDGGAGNDSYVVDNAGDVVIESADNARDIDTVYSHIDYTLGDNVENLVLQSGAHIGTGNALKNTITGGDGNDTLDGGAGSDTVRGGGGDDRIILDLRADAIGTRRADTDTLDGGTGENTLVLRLTNEQAGDAAVQAALAQLQAAIDAGKPFSSTLLGIKASNFSALEIIPDAAANNAPTNILLSAAAVAENDAGAIIGALTVTDADSGDSHTFSINDSRFEVRNGMLCLKSGASLDFESASSVAITITATDAGGMSVSRSFTITVTDMPDPLFTAGDDTVDFASIAAGAFDSATFYDAGDGADHVTLPTAAAAALLGYNATTVFHAGGGNDVVTGRDMNDSIDGGTGNDTLDGGAGADWLSGGSGNDVYYVDQAGDVVVEGVNGGNDTIYTSVAFALPDNVENLTATGNNAFNLIGNALDNILTGNDAEATVTLDGGAGADTMIGGRGSDIYIVDNAGDVVIEEDYPSHDIVYAGVSFTLPDYVEYLTLTGTAVSGTGNALNNKILGNDGDNTLSGLGGIDEIAGGGGNDTIYGGDSDDVLWGEAGADILSGGAGNDELYGGPGADTMTGDAGADYFYIDSSDATDVITDFNAGEGDVICLTDLIFSYNPITMPLSDFVTAQVSGDDLVLSVDGDGAAGGFAFTPVVTLQGGAGLVDSLADLVASGALLVS